MTTISELNKLDKLFQDLSKSVKDSIDVIDEQLIEEIRNIHQAYDYVRDELTLSPNVPGATVGNTIDKLDTEDLLLFLSGHRQAKVLVELITHELHQRDKLDHNSVQKTFQRLQKEAMERVKGAQDRATATV